MLFLYLSIALAVLAAAVHSVVGEARLIRPLYTQHEYTGVMKSVTWRRLVRAVWHLPSLCWLLMALMTLTLVKQPGAPATIAAIPLYFASAVYAVSGIGNFIAMRGKHIGWVVLLGAAGCLLAAIQVLTTQVLE